jgi:steroid delta-isomerase
MSTNFSFSTMLRHLDAGTNLDRPASAPTETHMRSVLEAYVANIGVNDPDFSARYMATDLTGEDPVGAMNESSGSGGGPIAEVMAGLIDVPFTPHRAELTGPVRFTLGNKAAVPFKLWAQVDGRNISIDIIDVMTFDEDGKICDFRAYWGMDNVTVLD